MILTEAVPRPSFANHETFHLKYGWLKKAYDQVRQDPAAFSRDDATVRFGVGKNMVKSMRFWSIACKVLRPRGTAKSAGVAPTWIGDVIFDGDGGVDPYLERDETVWLLHWLLLAPPCRLPVWWMIMNEFSATNVKLDDITESVTGRITNLTRWKTPSPKSLKKDVDMFVRTYTNRRGKTSVEDYVDCPFRGMGLIKQASADTVRFVSGAKPGLSPLMAAYACLDYITRSDVASRSVSVSRLASEPGGVGHAFRLGERELFELIDSACEMSPSISCRNVNGAPHLVFDSAREAAAAVLSKMYGRRVRPEPIIRGAVA